ncbi:GNAT family N-acetyltransferase [Levilactobacillus suantsaii]|uniref:GNAT family N-acetyltransferase n=1 Tax=Levilactobacillus suantsaii TaxID=2292255 RepID=A0A4Q0VKY0_9LACO|nr:GNAT family N-acetyltransferase [Levilactobacillus suantsaii]RXI79908.1 GNAT family N-acetyltransferase [Levilactobacillus suantsaii]
MLLRQATMADLSAIKAIIQDGRDQLAAQNIDQWQGTYPETTVLADDIRQGWTVVLEENDEILGTTAIIPGIDPSYQTISGQWLTHGANYLAIHRVAVSAHHRGHGLAGKLFQQLFELVDQVSEIESIRVDTHPQNQAMQHIIQKNGFTPTGEIELVGMSLDGVKDLAYERVTTHVRPEHLFQPTPA